MIWERSSNIYEKSTSSALRRTNLVNDANDIWPSRSSQKAAKISKVVAESSGDEADAASDPDGATSSAKPKKRRPKGTGGIQVPDEWPWEEAKKVFEEPDVLPDEQIQVSCELPALCWSKNP